MPDVSTTGPGPLLVYGPRSLEYDFGPQHPLTPLRFRPGIDLLLAVGAAPSLEPSPASDADLETVHLPAYVEAVRRFSADPSRAPAMGIGISDNPAFPGMHEAAAAVADGSLRAMEAILRGDVEHAFHPGGGLHHAMAAKAWGFCIYNDPALAIMRARADGLRVLYLDLDTHHGDGVEAAFYGDPGVLTISFHESGRYLFPGTGFVDDLGEGAAAGSAVNVPLEPYTGETAWLARVDLAGAGAGRRVRAGRDRVAARRRHPRLGPARAPAGDDDGDGGGGPAGRFWSPIDGRAADGSRRVAAATTRTGWCRGRGR